MPEQIVIGNFSKGLTLDRLGFVIDNDAFTTLYNFYAWRGRVKKKRGTTLLARLEFQLQSVASPNVWQVGPIVTLDGSGDGTANLNTLFDLPLDSLVPGSFTLSDGTNTYTEPAVPNGTLIGTPAGTGTINYATGALTITGGAPGGVLIGTFSYYPGLPVMGLRNFINSNSTADYPLLIAFDTKYAYELNQTNVIFFYNITFYKNTNIPFTWTGQNYQQFWTTNYSGAFWATNNKPGFQFKLLTNTLAGGKSVLQVTATQVTVGLTAHGLVTGDYLFFNEVVGTIGTGSGTTANQNINGQTGQVVVVDANTLTVNFTGSAGTNLANFQGGASGTGGLAEYLTNTPFPSNGDGIRWYDGDPTSVPMTGGTGLPTGTGLGWVNFSPPLSLTPISIDNLPPAIYYLVGALAILPFKDRILFFSPWVQTSTGAAIQLEDTVLWSWNGTPYYSALIPANQTFNVTAYYVDETGRGGYLPAGIDQAITTVTNNEDVILVGFSNRQTRLVYTGNDLQPFLFYNINSELGSLSTFSGITLDRGGMAIGNYGITLTTQTGTERIDLQIPDTIFEIQNLNNGVQRVNAVRDFYREWVYFTYPIASSPYVFPTQTLLYNYRDVTWAILYENFTAQGTFRRASSYTWATLPFPSWETWREPWDAGSSEALFPSIIGGTPQGFVLVRSEGTSEAQSCYIEAISNDGLGNAEITSPNHCVLVGDFVYFLGAIGITALNGQIGRVITVQDDDHFSVDLPFPAGTYLGLGTFAKLIQPLMQTKQFQPYWNQGKQARLGMQQYLLDTTSNGQGSLYIYLSQNLDNAYNVGNIVPAPNVTNNSLIYSQTLYTSPEPATQQCTNTPLGTLGNGVLTTLMLNYQQIYGFTGPIVPSSLFIKIGNVATFTDNGSGGFTATGTGVGAGSSVVYDTGLVTLVFSVAPNAQVSTTTFQYLYDNIQSPTALSQQQIWHRVNTSLIGDTVQVGITISDAQMRDLDYATSEITLHAIQINTSPGPYLS